MIYLDTSVVVALLTPEDRSPLGARLVCAVPREFDQQRLADHRNRQRPGHQAATAWPQGPWPAGVMF